MSNAKVVNIPLVAQFKLLAALCPTNATPNGLMSSIPYESSLSNIMYLIICTRPNITYAIRKMNRCMSNLGQEHWEVVKCIMKYIKFFLDIVLLFDAQSKNASLLWCMLMLIMKEIWISGYQQLDMSSFLLVNA